MLPYSNNINKTNKTIYINPNFRGQLPTSETTGAINSLQTTSVIPKNAHINPLFLEAHKSRPPTIHMNPAFLQKFQKQQQLLEQHKQNEDVQKNILFENEKKSSTTYQEDIEKVIKPVNINNGIMGESRKIICKSKNRLIREPLVKTESPPLKLSKPSIPQPPLLVLNKRKLIRKITSVPVVDINKTELKRCDNSKAVITKYKLVRKTPLLPPTPKIKRTAFVGRYALRRISLSQSTNTLLLKKTSTIKKSLNKKLQVLNINGLLYKSTQNTLKLKNIATMRSTNSATTKSAQNLLPAQKSTANLSEKSNQGLTIFVRGTKYVMDANKFKLTRVTNDELSTTNAKSLSNGSFKGPNRQRIDIGGYTYISMNSSKNVFIRTTNHLSRAYVHNAKQKSLQTLTKRLAKTNIPCPIFQRIGKCAAYERGKCSKVHNKLQVSICSKFLRGECLKTNCLLSHNVSLSKMPVCKFFLQGVCVRNDCPYLHKKLSNETELCIDFLRGFCQLAEKCNKRHEFTCPEIERNNVCKTKNCIYCNAKRRKELQLEKKTENKEITTKANINPSVKSNSEYTEDVQEITSSKRYFIEPCSNSMNEKIEENIVDDSNETDMKDLGNTPEAKELNRKTRPKLGTLPSYIPL